MWSKWVWPNCFHLHINTVGIKFFGEICFFNGLKMLSREYNCFSRQNCSNFGVLFFTEYYRKITKIREIKRLKLRKKIRKLICTFRELASAVNFCSVFEFDDGKGRAVDPNAHTHTPHAVNLCMWHFASPNRPTELSTNVNSNCFLYELCLLVLSHLHKVNEWLNDNNVVDVKTFRLQFVCCKCGHCVVCLRARLCQKLLR